MINKPENSGLPVQGARDTIFALSSGTLPAGVAVVRISGPRAFDVRQLLVGQLPAARRASLRTIRALDGAELDRGLVLVFAAGLSFTGEDCVELQLHGSRAVVAALQRQLLALGFRMAEAGEFSRRAFENGRMDLVEVEGLSDLLAAETEMQRRLAMDQASGQRSELYQNWLTRLTRARALIEAELDFSDEEDIPGAVSETLWPDLEAVHREMVQHAGHGGAAAIVRDGFKVVIVGKPNAGKSSLLNALAKRDVAIVTEIAGTTRDIIGLDVDIDGYMVHLMDTAGIRDTSDPVEQEGVKRAQSAVRAADLILLLQASDDPDPAIVPTFECDSISVLSKADLLPDQSSVLSDLASVSTKTGAGLDSLTKRISVVLASKATGALSGAATRRQQDLVNAASLQLGQVLEHREMPLEVRAEGLRRSSHALEKMLGRVDVEDLLGVIFSEFCVGK